MTVLDRRTEADIIDDQRAEIEQLKIDNGFFITETPIAKLRAAFSLTHQEAWLFHAIHNRGARGLTHEQAITHMPATADPLDRFYKQISVQVCRIRAKAGPDVIETLWAQGYRITPAGRAKIAGVLKEAAQC